MATNRTSFTNRIVIVNSIDDVDTSVDGIFVPYNDWQLMQVGFAFQHLNNEVWRIESQQRGEVVITNGVSRRKIVRNDWKGERGGHNYHTHRPARGAKNPDEWTRHPIDQLIVSECTKRSQNPEVYGKSHLWHAKAMSKYALIAHVLLGRTIFVQACFVPEDFERISKNLYAPIKAQAKAMTKARIKVAYDYEALRGQARGKLPEPQVLPEMRDFVRTLLNR
jgi:hypothetical protein